MEIPKGWLKDDLEAVLSVLGAQTPLPAREFFESGYVFDKPRLAHFTGYFETVISAHFERGQTHQVPLYGPPEFEGPYPTRAEIVENGLQAEILAWLAEPLDAFLLQVQGSGRLHFPDGQEIGIGYAGPAEQMSLDVIRSYCGENPTEVIALLNTNPSYVFFQLRDATTGPIGAMGIPVTPFRSIAVDPDHIPLGTPVWIEVEIEGTLHQSLMIAQDIGSAIKGPARADIFCGTGESAGEIAGRLNCSGKMIPLLPATG